jgi:hypothetical protein
MRQFRFEYYYDEVFELCSGVTLQKVYSASPNPSKGVEFEENFRLSELYALTVDEKDFFALNCLKQACDNVFLSLKRHSFGNEPYGFYIDKEIEDPSDPNKTVIVKIIYYDVEIGAVQDTMIRQYILNAIRDFALKEWYKMKGELTLAPFYENEYQNNIKKLYHYTKGYNRDDGNINTAKRRGVFN